MLVDVSVQVVLSTLCFWQLAYDPVDNDNVQHAVVGLVGLHTASSIFCVVTYRVPELHASSKAAHYVGCVPSIGRLHRRRFSFFAATATASLLLFVCTRTIRQAAIMSALLYFTTAVFTMLHCDQRHAFWLYFAGSVVVSVIFLLEALFVQNIIGDVVGYII